MIQQLGFVRPGSTIRIPFNSFDKDDGSSITMTNYVAADILVYKDGSTTERASTSGFTATTDFDSKTGKHLAVIDLSDNTTAGFWSVGSEYVVAIDAVTVDAVTVGGWIARFTIGTSEAILNTTIATVSSQTSITLTAGPAEDDAINGMWGIIHDVASAVQMATFIVSDYVGSTKTVTLAVAPTFTIAATDGFMLIAPAPLQSTIAARPLDVSTGGEAGVDWANVGSPTTSLALTGTTIAVTQKVDVDTIKTNPVVNAGTITFPTTATLASTTNITAGTITTATNVTTVNGLAANVITAASVADGAIDAATFAADVDAEILSYIVDDATRIDASSLNMATVTTVPAILVDTAEIGAAGAGLTAVPWNAAWDAEVQSEVQDAIEVNHLDHLLAADYDPASKPGVSTALLNELIGNDAGVSQFTANALELAPTGGSAPTAAAIADAVWDEAQADHVSAGSFGVIASEIESIKTKTDFLPSATAGAAGGVFIAGTNAPVTITGSGNALTLTSTGGNGHGLAASGNGSGEGLLATGGATGNGIQAVGGATSGSGLYCAATTSGAGLAAIAAGNNNGIEGSGAGTGAGLSALGGASGDGFHVEGVGTGHGMHVAADSGNGIYFDVTSGGDIVGNITGNLSGSVGSVTGAVGSVTGSVGSIATGGIAAASFAAGAIDAAAIATDAIGSAEISAAAVTKIQTGLATPTNITAGTITTVTNLTNAATSGDLTATMKASVNTEIDTALADIHLDHLLAADYDPASKPGVSTALLNELIGNDAGVSQFTANALELAPTGGSAPTAAAIADAVWDEAQADHVSAGSFGVIASEIADILVDTAEIGAAGAGLTEAGGTGDQLTAIPWNASWDAEVQSEVQDAIEVNHLDHLLAADYDPASKPGVSTALLNELIGNDAGVSQFTANALELAPTGGSAPTAAAIADAVWDEAQADHVSAGSFGVIASEIADILVDTAEIGAAGAGLTNINLPNQTMDIVGNITGNLSGSVGSVTGAVGSVSGNVSGNVTGSVGSVVGLTVGNLDATVSSRLATAGYTAPDNVSIAAAAADVAELNNTKITTARAAVLSDWIDGGRLDLILDAIPTTIRMKKNTAFTGFTFPMFDADDLPLTGLTVTATRSIDAGSFAACANAVSEVGSGVYKLDLSAGDLNGNDVMLKLSASGSKTTFIKIVMQP